MSNIRNGNTFYIDTQYSSASDELAIKGVRVPYIIVSSSATTNQVILSDSGGNAKINIQNINSAGSNGDTRVFRFDENPILFPNGIRATTLTRCTVTCVIIDPRG